MGRCVCLHLGANSGSLRLKTFLGCFRTSRTFHPSSNEKMKSLPLAVLFASAVVAGLTRKTSDQLVLGHSSETEYQYLIELGPGDTKWIVEEEKWALKRVRLCGMC